MVLANPDFVARLETGAPMREVARSSQHGVIIAVAADPAMSEEIARLFWAMLAASSPGSTC
jgi:hypothetical protein